MPQRTSSPYQLPLLPPDIGPARRRGPQRSGWANWMESSAVILAVVGFGLLWAVLAADRSDPRSLVPAPGSAGPAALSSGALAVAPGDGNEDGGHRDARQGRFENASRGIDVVDRRLQRAARWPAAS